MDERSSSKVQGVRGAQRPRSTERWATFDCYGTLVDWEGGIARTFLRLWPQANPARLLERYHELEPQVQQGSSASYAVVLTDVLVRLADDEGLRLGDEERSALARSLPEWPPFPEVPDALRELRSRGWRLAILSNTDPEFLAASVSRIGVDVDQRITVAEAGSYKPAHGHWETFFQTSGAVRDAHVHVAASLFHDIHPAHALGLRSVWINRRAEDSDAPRDAELPDLRGLPDTLDGMVPDG